MRDMRGTLTYQIALAKSKADAAEVGVVVLATILWGWKGLAISFFGTMIYAAIGTWGELREIKKS